MNQETLNVCEISMQECKAPECNKIVNGCVSCVSFELQWKAHYCSMDCYNKVLNIERSIINMSENEAISVKLLEELESSEKTIPRVKKYLFDIQEGEFPVKNIATIITMEDQTFDICGLYGNKVDELCYIDYNGEEHNFSLDDIKGIILQGEILKMLLLNSASSLEEKAMISKKK